MTSADVFEPNETSWTIRRVEPKDWKHLKEVRLRALQDSPQSFGSSYEKESLFNDATWQSRASSAGQLIGATWFGMRADQSASSPAVGLVKLWETDVPTDGVDLVSMWVDPVFRGTGLANALVVTAIAEARQHQKTFVTLWVTQQNEPAIRLYSSIGFLPTGEVDSLPSNPCIGELRMKLIF
jgi:ribosomal protein S18 acetylase RimI-like enzyme